MADTEADKTPAEKAEEKPKYPQAHVGHKETEEIVGTALGEGIDRKIADIADGDD